MNESNNREEVQSTAQNDDTAQEQADDDANSDKENQEEPNLKEKQRDWVIELYHDIQYLDSEYYKLGHDEKHLKANDIYQKFLKKIKE